MTTSTDRIEKTIVLQANQSRVWRALSDSTEFGAWFCFEFDGPFVPGEILAGRVTSSSCANVTFRMAIEKMEAESLFSYRWHPHAVDPDFDYSSEEMTLVEFRLAAEGDTTRVTVIESGFDKVPESRRDVAFRMNNGGWDQQIQNLERYVTSK